jgi:hypothetical protein
MRSSAVVQAKPTVQSKLPAAAETDFANLSKLGMLCVVRCRYCSSRAGNDPQDIELTPVRIDAKVNAGPALTRPAAMTHRTGNLAVQMPLTRLFAQARQVVQGQRVSVSSA